MIITTDIPRCIHLNCPDSAPLPEGAREWGTEQEGAAYLASLPPLIQPEPTYSTADYIAAVEAAFDSASKAHGYDNIDRACSYAGAPNPFQAESQAFVAWRGNVWAACYAAQANPPEVQPTPEAFVTSLLQDNPAP